MSTNDRIPNRTPIHLAPGQGRSYPMGRIAAVFKADGQETQNRYSVSEWWLEAHTKGPGAHSHEEDDLFFVIAGTMSILMDERWIDAPTGSFVLVPGGMTHDFENRSSARAGVLDLSIPGNFEEICLRGVAVVVLGHGVHQEPVPSRHEMATGGAVPSCAVTPRRACRTSQDGSSSTRPRTHDPGTVGFLTPRTDRPTLEPWPSETV